MPNDGHPAGDFLAPRLAALLADARDAGIAPEVATAVLIDLLERDAAFETDQPA